MLITPEKLIESTLVNFRFHHKMLYIIFFLFLYLRTLHNFLSFLNSDSNNTGNIDKFNLLINLVSTAV